MYVYNSPEAQRARLGRLDSKAPSRTCRGVAPSTGNQCRRAIKPSNKFCFQHRDQEAHYHQANKPETILLDREQQRHSTQLEEKKAKKKGKFSKFLNAIRKEFKNVKLSEPSLQRKRYPPNIIANKPNKRLKDSLIRKNTREPAIMDNKECSKRLQMSDWIHPSLPPNTKQKLRMELSTPPSAKDEPGYIYVFFLEDDMRRLPPQHVLLKIGRANNVQRRLSEWSSQCRYNPSLSMYYPNPSFPPGAGFRTTRASHKIERLIHLEFRERFAYTSSPCPACARVHREWFLFRHGSDKDLFQVLQVVERWVEFGRLHYGEVMKQD